MTRGGPSATIYNIWLIYQQIIKIYFQIWKLKIQLSGSELLIALNLPISPRDSSAYPDGLVQPEDDCDKRKPAGD